MMVILILILILAFDDQALPGMQYFDFDFDIGIGISISIGIDIDVIMVTKLFHDTNLPECLAEQDEAHPQIFILVSI